MIECMKNPFNQVASPQQRLSSTLAAIQTSLFSRLKKAYPHNRGHVAWVLVWAAQPMHKKHGEAMACLRTVPPEEMAGLRVAVEACANASGKEDDASWHSACGLILEALDPRPVTIPGVGPAAPVLGRVTGLSVVREAPVSGTGLVRVVNLVTGVVGRTGPTGAAKLVARGTHVIAGDVTQAELDAESEETEVAEETTGEEGVQ